MSIKRDLTGLSRTNFFIQSVSFLAHVENCDLKESMIFWQVVGLTVYMQIFILAGKFALWRFGHSSSSDFFQVPQ